MRLPDAGNSRAVLVGVAGYERSLTPLPGVRTSVEDLHALLVGEPLAAFHRDACAVVIDPEVPTAPRV